MDEETLKTLGSRPTTMLQFAFNCGIVNSALYRADFIEQLKSNDVDADVITNARNALTILVAQAIFLPKS